jgi:hypothetical protein
MYTLNAASKHNALVLPPTLFAILDDVKPIRASSQEPVTDGYPGVANHIIYRNTLIRRK